MARNLVVCCDGTWNTAYQARNGSPCPTNVTRVALSIADRTPSAREQRVYYHPGVGTHRWDRIGGGAFGIGLSANVQDAYRFLVDNYEDGDRLFFFGFSRGAFTARSVAGLVRNCGILRRENRDRIPDAYRLYRTVADKPRGMTSTLFRSAFSVEPDIEFIGVWDTVGALGIPPSGPRFLHPIAKAFNKRWAFHDTRLSSHVRGAYHALAIDEQRLAFAPTLWQQQPGANQILEQVWFAGVHCNVGGGLPDSSLSDLALLWMVQKAQEHGVAFRSDAFPSHAAPDVDEPNSSEETTFTVSPNPISLPDHSRVGLYKVLAKAYDRPIGVETGATGGHRQTVSDCAVALRAAKPDEYKPPKLVEYLARVDRPAPTTIPVSYDSGHIPAASGGLSRE